MLMCKMLFQAIYSRVARVCKSDQGGPHKFRDNWTSFLKTRLNCSVPGEQPFYFDEIQSTSGLVDGHLIYGVFTTPDNSISGSAICAFSIKDITERYKIFQLQLDVSFWRLKANGVVKFLFSSIDTDVQAHFYYFLAVHSRLFCLFPVHGKTSTRPKPSFLTF